MRKDKEDSIFEPLCLYFLLHSRFTFLTFTPLPKSTSGVAPWQQRQWPSALLLEITR